MRQVADALASFGMPRFTASLHSLASQPRFTATFYSHVSQHHSTALGVTPAGRVSLNMAIICA